MLGAVFSWVVGGGALNTAEKDEGGSAQLWLEQGIPPGLGG